MTVSPPRSRHLSTLFPSSSSEPPTPKGPIRDESILHTSEYVRLVDPVTGSLAGPFNTKQILTKLDRTKFFLQQVAPAQPSQLTVHYDPSSPTPIDPAVLVQYPICKLIDKKEEFDRLRHSKRKPSDSTTSTTSSSKEVQLTWSVSPNDLAHKLGKAKKELLKGARINVVVTTKAGGRKYIKGLNPKEDEKRGRLLQEVERFLCEEVVEGEGGGKTETVARRLQEVEWQRGGSAAVMSFEAFRNKS